MKSKKMLEKALKFAIARHGKQKDDDGNPYWWHVSKVAELLKHVTNDEEILAAAYLHDTLEDTGTTYVELKKEFGKRIADLVMEVTHEGNKKDGYYFPRLKSRDAILIKFADRLHNISRMKPWSEKRRQKYLKKSRFWKLSGAEK